VLRVSGRNNKILQIHLLPFNIKCRIKLTHVLYLPACINISFMLLNSVKASSLQGCFWCWRWYNNQLEPQFIRTWTNVKFQIHLH
jgi:hypothetical protein